MNKSENKIKGILFFTIFLNLTGFSIILPLSPALLDFYLPQQEQSGGMLGQFVSLAKNLAMTIGQGDSHFMVSVFFGCLLASLYAFLQFLFSPIWGRISDKYGRRNVLLFSLLGTALSYILWVIADNFELFVYSRVFAGVMAGNITIASAAMADITSKANRAKGMAIIGVAFGLGFLFGPAFGGLLTKINPLDYFPQLSAYGVNKYSMPAFFATILAIINILWVLKTFPETYPKAQRLLKEVEPSLIATFKQQTPSIAKTNFAYFLFLLSFSGLEFTLAFLAKERFDYGPLSIGYLFLYIGFVLIFTQGYLIRRLSPVLGERCLATIGMVFGMTSFLLLGLTIHKAVFYLGSAFLAMGIGFTTPSLSALVSLYATEQTQGRYLGLFRASGSLARALGPTVVAIFYFLFGGKVAYLGVSSLLLIPLIIIFSLPEPIKFEKT